MLVAQTVRFSAARVANGEPAYSKLSPNALAGLHQCGTNNGAALAQLAERGYLDVIEDRAYPTPKLVALLHSQFHTLREDRPMTDQPTPTAEQREAARRFQDISDEFTDALAQLLATREAEARAAGFRDGYAAGVTDEREEDDVIRAEARADERRKIRDMLVASSLDETPSQTLDRVYAEMCEDVPRADRNVIALEPAERQPNIDEARLATRIADSLVTVDPDDQVTRAAFQEGLFRLLVKYPMIDKRAAFDIARWARREEER